MINLNKTRNSELNYAYDEVIHKEDATASRKFIANVFLWMFVALGVSAFAAYEFATVDSLRALVIDPITHRGTGLGTIVMIAPLAFIMVMSYGLNKLSYGVLVILFVAFAIIMGISLSYVLLAYTASSVLGVFITTSVVFAVMAVAGYTTNQDLTKFGAILTMFLIGIIVASAVNMFLGSSGLSLIITYIGVAVFVGLTAYNVQNLKRIGASDDIEGGTKSKLGLIGALTLYLNFVNLFLMLLRLFGGGSRR